MIIDLGLVDFEQAYAVQRDLIVRRKLNEVEDSLIVAEHKTVITIGRQGRMQRSRNLLVDEELLRELGIRVLEIDRGGDITLHAPGQLVLYPIVALKGVSRDLHRHMRSLEEAAISCLSRFGIKGFRLAGRTGVWTSPDEKIASIGIGCRDWITYHGLSLNVNIELKFFSMVRLCGMRHARATSMKTQLKRTLDAEEVKRIMIKNFSNAFAINENMPAIPGLSLEGSLGGNS